MSTAEDRSRANGAQSQARVRTVARQQQAEALIKAGAWNEAERQVRETLRTDPRDPRALSDLRLIMGARSSRHAPPADAPPADEPAPDYWANSAGRITPAPPTDPAPGPTLDTEPAPPTGFVEARRARPLTPVSQEAREAVSSLWRGASDPVQAAAPPAPRDPVPFRAPRRIPTRTLAIAGASLVAVLIVWRLLPTSPVPETPQMPGSIAMHEPPPPSPPLIFAPRPAAPAPPPVQQAAKPPAPALIARSAAPPVIAEATPPKVALPAATPAPQPPPAQPAAKSPAAPAIAPSPAPPVIADTTPPKFAPPAAPPRPAPPPVQQPVQQAAKLPPAPAAILPSLPPFVTAEATPPSITLPTVPPATAPPPAAHTAPPATAESAAIHSEPLPPPAPPSSPASPSAPVAAARATPSSLPAALLSDAAPPSIRITYPARDASLRAGATAFAGRLRATGLPVDLTPTPRARAQGGVFFAFPQDRAAAARVATFLGIGAAQASAADARHAHPGDILVALERRVIPIHSP